MKVKEFASVYFLLIILNFSIVNEDHDNNKYFDKDLWVDGSHLFFHSSASFIQLKFSPRRKHTAGAESKRNFKAT